ncbi:hypothetical protein [Pseudomonas sp. zfem002]|uniref:hypothetical protein n=1 Tax=Pseudomonas sp. zfem002 TaxID=3078197 RepID=UPI0029297257|nr:hypothetical protein [Pseudomonas sp. zfem002]MDU9394306.1 hypothetical protein [Pseudomonas sp. zfem002]
MRALIVIDDGLFPDSYIKSGTFKLDFVPEDRDFSYILLVEWDHYNGRPSRFKWLARVNEMIVKLQSPGSSLTLHGFWQVTGSQRDFKEGMKYSKSGFKHYADVNDDVWSLVEASHYLKEPEFSGFISLKEATARLASSYGVPESAVKINITN